MEYIKHLNASEIKDISNYLQKFFNRLPSAREIEYYYKHKIPKKLYLWEKCARDGCNNILREKNASKYCSRECKINRNTLNK